MLGRNGDLINACQICYHEYLRTRQPARLIVGEEFRPLLDGFSYIEPIVFHGTQNELARALTLFPKATVLQSWLNPDQRRLTDSYQKEAWRRAGKLDAFGTVPLVIDRRSPEREVAFCSHFAQGKPVIIVAISSPSSPFPQGSRLLHAVRESFPGHAVFDICLHGAHRFYDLLGLLGRASLLITIDTAHLHLARASRCPVIAIVNDVGSRATPGPWTASVPPPQAISTFRYSEFATADNAVELAVNEAVLAVRGAAPRIVHAVDMWDASDRHAHAQKSWAGLFDSDSYGFHTPDHRTAKSISDPRALPYLKDLLHDAFYRFGVEDDDIVFWSNSDNSFSPELPAFLRKHVSLYGACSFRRTEKGTPGVHTGRDAFAFTKRWLEEHWKEIPDFLLGAPSFDLCLAALIRLQRGIVTTADNLTTDFFPCDIGPGYVYHEPHESAWVRFSNSPGNRHNRRLFREWSLKHLPRLRFNYNDELIP